jgi:hypothetical protein
MRNALYLAALTLTLTACAGSRLNSTPTTAHNEAWRLAFKPNAARLANESVQPTRPIAESAPLEAWQLAHRPNAARLADYDRNTARQLVPQQRAMVSRLNKAMP